MDDSEQITSLLLAWSEGDEASFDQLLPLVETELRRIAHRFMRREKANHTLQTTALVNEAYLRLVKQPDVTWQNRTHFFAIAARIMRRILLNYARDRHTQKRGGDAIRIDFEEAVVFSPEKSAEIIALDEALERLKSFDELKSAIVELRHFGGLSLQETAEVLGVSTSTVSLHWRLAKAWLAAELKKN